MPVFKSRAAVLFEDAVFLMATLVVVVVWLAN